MTWQDWAVLGGLGVLVLVVVLARRSAGRKRVEALGTALSAAEARGYAAATVKFSMDQRIAATASNVVNVAVQGERAGRSGDRVDQDVALLERDGVRSAPVLVDAGKMSHGRDVHPALLSGGVVDVAGHGAVLDPPQGPGRLAPPDSYLLAIEAGLSHDDALSALRIIEAHGSDS